MSIDGDQIIFTERERESTDVAVGRNATPRNRRAQTVNDTIIVKPTHPILSY